MKIKKGLQQTVTKFSQILGILSNNFKLSLVQKFSRIKVCNALALPSLVCGSKISILRKGDKKCLTSIGTKFSEEQVGTSFLMTRGMTKFWMS